MKGVVYTEIKVIDGSFSVCKVTDFSEVDPSKNSILSRQPTKKIR